MHDSSALCPVCAAPDWRVFFTMPAVPVFCNLLWPDPEAAQHCPKAEIDLAFCSHCGFIGNATFDPSRLDYGQTYENALDFSPRFQDYANALALRLIEQYHLRHKTIVEIGCGKGEFLVSLCEKGNNRGIGFDPSYVPLPEHEPWQEQIQFIPDYYSERYADRVADFICCRHTLEHIPLPNKLLHTVRQAIGDGSIPVFFEVPNALDTFRHLAIWDIIYEHCCYFAPITLTYAFAANGFQVQNLTEAYRGQFLCVEAVPADPCPLLPPAAELELLAQDVAQFASRFHRKLSAWQQTLDELQQQGKTAVVWGAGSKGVTFLNLISRREQIQGVVDINPRKTGMYVAGTGQQIIAPEALPTVQPDVIFVMNAIYQDEIRQMAAEQGLSPDLVCV
ncbi:MAG: methyltransferase domain-containing protein [Synechococcales cyanobacterium C42_A2020_086]|jgi:hypothetical protein|nr:methyltransferase domain-containing protein [Synechococcales cyanobacterium C42_A2020_086]